MTEFSPTWLYIKQHNITGLKYFGKTISNPASYQGSGTYWSSHIKKHGRDVTTIWTELFNDRDNLIEFAIFFSELHNIVKCDKWANLKQEDGLMGGHHGNVTDETRLKLSISSKGRNAGEKHHYFGKSRPEHSEFMKNNNPMKDSEISRKLGENRRGVNHPGFGKIGTTTGKKLATYRCEHCCIETTGGNIARWHGNNCKKFKEIQ